MSYTIGQVSEKTGLSPYTIRYYDRAGLLPFVERGEGGVRFFSDTDLEWLHYICCLRNTGMPIAQLRQFIGWCMQGDCCGRQRQELLARHRDAVLRQIEDLRENLRIIDYKIAHYDEMFGRKFSERLAADRRPD